MSTSSLIAATRKALHLTSDPVLEPIVRGGSDRTFHRVLQDGICLAVVVVYGTEKAENALYAGHAAFLEKLGVRVPAVLADAPAERILWLEELGRIDLHSFREHDWPVRKTLYENVLHGIFPLHRKGLVWARELKLELMEGFGPALYRWEHDYFLREFIGGVCGIDAENDAELRAELDGLSSALIQAVPALVHRDFQSQNIMIKDHGACFIDFQGMREGTYFYDLGSLLYDPYVEIAPDERLELLRFYHGLWRGEAPAWDEFVNLFSKAAVQRLMQALGAYGFLGLKKGKPAFLQHIPGALRHIDQALGSSGLPRLHALLDRIPEKVKTGSQFKVD
jgi:aminoglycoside/choline kinase family phosphotransferase